MQPRGSEPHELHRRRRRLDRAVTNAVAALPHQLGDETREVADVLAGDVEPQQRDVGAEHDAVAALRAPVHRQRHEIVPGILAARREDRVVGADRGGEIEEDGRQIPGNRGRALGHERRLGR